MNNHSLEKTEEKVRLFVAVELPQEVRDVVADVAKKLEKKKLFEGTFVSPEDRRLTLRFLGEVPASMVKHVIKALQGISVKKFYADLGVVDVFPSPSSIQTIFMHVECEELDLLAHIVDSALDGLVPENDRPFLSHLTLARVKAVKDPQKLLQALEDLEDSKTDFLVDTLVLMQSQQTDKGMVYTPLSTILLK